MKTTINKVAIFLAKFHKSLNFYEFHSDYFIKFAPRRVTLADADSVNHLICHTITMNGRHTEKTDPQYKYLNLIHL